MPTEISTFVPESFQAQIAKLSVRPNFTTLLSIYPGRLETATPYASLVTFIHPGAQKDMILHRTYSPERLMNEFADQEEPLFLDEEVPPGRGQKGYNLVSVPTTYQWVTDVNITDRRGYRKAPQESQNLASELQKNWSRQGTIYNTTNGSIGITILQKDQDPNLMIPTLWEQQRILAVQVVYEADRLESEKDNKQINDNHRMWAKWLGVTDRLWLQNMDPFATKPCPACGEKIKMEAVRCRFCQQDLSLWYSEQGIPPTDPAIVHLRNVKKGWAGQKAAAGKSKDDGGIKDPIGA